MTTSKRCSECNKELGQIHCAGCDKYFCWKDFKTHREGMFIQLDKIIEERNHLQDEISTVAQHNHQQSPLIQQINEWQDMTIEKVKQVAAKVRQQAVHLLNSKQVKISADFKDFSQELARLKESENFVEHDLTRLNQMISRFKQDLRQSTQPTTIKLHTEQSNVINWDRFIHIEGKQIYIDNQQRQPQAAKGPEAAASLSQKQLKCGGRACPKCGKCRNWYPNTSERRAGATCHYVNDVAFALARINNRRANDLAAAIIATHQCQCK